MDDECKIVYFYKNGHACEPKKITKTRCKLMEIITRDDHGNFKYEGKKLYTFSGEELLAFRPAVLPLYTGYVLVDEKDTFKSEDYQTSFLEMLKDMKRLKISCDEPKDETIENIEEFSPFHESSSSSFECSSTVDEFISASEYGMTSSTNVSKKSQCQSGPKDLKSCQSSQNASKKCSKSPMSTLSESRKSNHLPSNNFIKPSASKVSSIVKNQIYSPSCTFDKPKNSQITFVTDKSSFIANSETEFSCNEETSKEPDCEDGESSSYSLGPNKNKIEMKIKTNIVSSRQVFRADGEKNMSCGKQQECVNLYFFENGSICNPKKITKKRCELEELFCKTDKGFTYDGKTLYSLKGELICKFNPMEIPCDSGYVIVACEKFKCADYDTAFKKVIQPAPACPSC